MAFNELEAMKMIDEEKISDKEIQLLSRLRNGVALAEVEDDKEFEGLEDKGLVQTIDLSHPRADVRVPAVIPTEEGTTVLNLFDKRFRENSINANPDANTAPDVDPKLVKHPTDEEARKVPSLEKEPLPTEEKQNGYVPEANKEAMKDPLVAAGARNPSNAQTDDEDTVAKNATVKVEKNRK